MTEQFNSSESPQDENKKSNTSSERAKPIRLEDAMKRYEEAVSGKEKKAESNDAAFYMSPRDMRRNFRTRVSGRLALGLWSLLGAVVFIHIIGISYSAIQLSRKVGFQTVSLNEDDVSLRKQVVDDSVGMINDAVKTLYSFLTPLATAVTGYYFSAVETDESEPENNTQVSSSNEIE